MASRKEYEMQFKLNAQLASSYSVAFRAAQKEITQMQNELQAMNRLQADISSYQKQQQALEKTKDKLELLKQQYNNIQREISETGNYSSELENKLLSKQKQIEKTTDAINSQQQNLERLGASLQENGVDTSNLTQESKRLAAEFQSLKKDQEHVAEGFKEAGEEGEEFGDKSTSAVEGVASALAAAGIANVVREIAEAYIDCIKVAAEFEQSMSNVEALSGATDGEMTRLSGLAKELGATTKFTALESADAMGYMGMAGWNAQQMIAGMPGVLNLAAASGEDLATVSDIVTDSLTAFGMTAEDTNRYVDVLATAATNANTNVALMGESFKYVAPLAGALKYNCEDMAVAIGVLANSGIKGSEAGTALRGYLTRLAKPTKETSDAMEELGLSLSDGQGRMYSFMEIMEQTRDRFSGLNEEQKAFYAAALAGKRGISGLLAIVNASESDFAELSNAISNSTGAAKKMADIKMDNAAGQMTLMKSAFEAVQTSIGEQFTPSLADAYGEIAKILSGVNEFIQANPEVVKGVTTTIGVLGGAAMALSGVAAAIKLIGVVSATVPHVGAIMAVAGAVAVLAGAVAALWPQMSEEEKELQSLTATSRENYYEIQEMREQYEAAKETFGETSDEASRLRYQLDDMEAEFAKNKQTLEEFNALVERQVERQQEIQAAYSETSRSIDDQEQHTFSLVRKLQDLVKANDNSEESEQKIKSVIKQLNEELPDLALNYDDVVSGTNNWAEAMKRAAKSKADADREAARQDTWAEAYNNQQALIEKIAEAEKNLKKAREENNVKYNSELDAWLVNDAVNENLAVDEIAQYNRELEELHGSLEETGKTLAEVEGEWAAIDQANKDAGTSAAELEASLTVTSEKAKELAEAYQDAYTAAYEGISGSFGLFDQVSLEIKTSVSDMISSLDSQASYMESYSENLKKAAEMGISDGLLAALSDGSQESAAYLQEIVTNGGGKVDELNTAFAKVQEGKNKFSDTVAEMQTDFSKEMEKLVAETEKTIQAMDLQSEAAQAGYDTISGFISAATNPSTLARVTNAYSDLAKRARAAISSSSGTPIPGYAVGTKSAAPGFAMVGEKGPELIYFNGGEQVMTAQETAALQESRAMQEYAQTVTLSPAFIQQLSLMRGGAQKVYTQPEAAVAPTNAGVYQISLQPVYNINGATGSAEIEEQLRQHDERLREMITEILEEHEIDRERVRF